MITPPITASIIPTNTYIIATFRPKNDEIIITDAKSTKGEEIKNENVIPIGTLADINPINIGILEQLQNGVIVPNNAPSIFPFIPLCFSNIFFVLSGGK